MRKYFAFQDPMTDGARPSMSRLTANDLRPNPRIQGPGVLDGAGYHFDGAAGAGLTLTDAMGGDGATYTIALDVILSTIVPGGDGNAKLVDFANLTKDEGLYLSAADPVGPPPTPDGTLDLFVHGVETKAGGVLVVGVNRIVLTRDNATHRLKVYAGGVLAIDADDPTGDGIFASAGNIIQLFRDDALTAALPEVTSGIVRSVVLYDRALSAAEVAVLGLF